MTEKFPQPIAHTARATYVEQIATATIITNAADYVFVAGPTRAIEVHKLSNDALVRLYYEMQGRPGVRLYLPITQTRLFVRAVTKIWLNDGTQSNPVATGTGLLIDGLY